MDIVIRRAEPTDYEAMASILGDPLAYPGTLQLPYPSREMWRKRLAEMADGDFLLLATIGDEIVGQAGLHSAGRSQRPPLRDGRYTDVHSMARIKQKPVPGPV
jgi:hypothetical protein